MLDKKAQYSTEYVIIIGIAVGIIASFLVYVALFYGSFSTVSAASDITNIASSLAKEANYVTSQGVGSLQAFPITIPLLQPQYSFFCGNTIKLQTTTELGVAQPAENISGMLPLSGGTYDAFVASTNTQVLVGLKFAVSLIIQSYSISDSVLSYSLYFYNVSDLPMAKPVSFNISIFTTGGVYKTSTTGSTSISSPSTAFGTLTLPSPESNEYVVEVTPSNSGDYASACVSV